MRKIITIGREFGAGGGEIGKRVANELGIPYYDKDIILKTAMANRKLNPEQVLKWDEKVPGSFGFAVGRNGDYILREFDHCLNVFIHAGFQWRVRRMSGMMPDTPREQVAADVKAADKARKKYCAYYTGKTYGDSRNFDLTLNTEKIGIDRAVQLVLAAAEEI